MPKLKVSKKSVLIASTLVVLVGVPLIAYLLISNQEESRSWYSSSWLYRQAITVSHSDGSSRTNEDVLLTINTSGLVGSSKLQADCDDLRFVDSDDSTILDYWIEGGCNTTTTKVWVRIPSLPSGGYTIYMYYGNPSATNAEETWTGKFELLTNSTTSCPTGWTNVASANTNFRNKFVMGSTTYGTTGGTDSSHDHGGTFSFMTGGANRTSASISSSGGSGSVPETIGHQVSGDILTSSSLPPYKSANLCERTKLTNITNLIFFSDSSLPSGWTRETTFDNKFPFLNYGIYGDTGGNATHSHTLSDVIVDPNGLPEGSSTGTTFSTASPTHTHLDSTTIDTESNMPPYKIFIYSKAPTLDTLNQTLIAGTSGVPPLGWTQYTTLNNFFPMGGSSCSAIPSGYSAHEHTISTTLANASDAVNRTTGSSYVSTHPSHGHTGSTTTSSVSNLPPYATVIYAKRKASLTPSYAAEESYDPAPTDPTSLLTEGATNPTEITDTTPEFSAIYNDASQEDTALYYEIEVNTNNTFTGTVMWDSGKTSMTAVAEGDRIADKSYAGTALTLNGTTYYWRIRLWDQSDNVSPWATAQFTLNYAPSAPTDPLTETQINPVGVRDTTPEFSAIFNDSNVANTGLYYEIEVNTNATFNSTVMWDTGKTSMTAVVNGVRSAEISYAGTTLTLNGNTYYWRIRFWDNNDSVSVWSSTAQFTMNRVPNAPSAPLTEGETNPIKVTDLTPEFSAIFSDPDTIDTAVRYEVQVNTSSNFQGTVMWQSNPLDFPLPIVNGQRSSDISYAGTTLSLDGSLYYWRLRFFDQYYSASGWSTVSTFIMSGPPSAPSNITVDGQPSPTQYISSLTPKFAAQHSDSNGDSAIYYEIEVNTNNTFSGTVMWDTDKQSMTSTPNGSVSPQITYAGTALSGSSTTYYWRIRFWDTDDNVSAWSATGSFVDLLQYFRFEGLKLEGLKIN